MFVNDRTENIGTSGCRLSPELCELQLNSPEGRDSAAIVKPVYIRSRVSQKKHGHPWVCFLMHNPSSRGCTLC